MHHGSELSDLLQSEALELKLGATGLFPEGKLHDSDEGEIKFAVGRDVDARKVILNFGKPVAWIVMNADQAVALGHCLMKHAGDVRYHVLPPRSDDDCAADKHSNGERP